MQPFVPVTILAATLFTLIGSLIVFLNWSSTSAWQAKPPLRQGYTLQVVPTQSDPANESPDDAGVIAISLAPAEPALTPLASLVLRINPAIRLETRGGMRSIADFGDQPAELFALLHSVGLCDLGFRTRISVTGEDKFRWLNGMVTNAVATLPEGHGNYNFILNAQGRIQGDANVFHEATRLLIETDRSQVAHLLEHFDRFIIMDDVELTDLSATTAIGLSGPGAAALLARLGFAEARNLEPLQFSAGSLSGADGALPVTLVRAFSGLTPRYEIWFNPANLETLWNLLLDEGAIAAGLAAQETLRILEAAPLYGVDILDRNLVQETSQTRALNFTKGCYLGQEIVERIRSRTTVHRFLRQMELSGTVPAANAELTSPGEARPIGHLTSIASSTMAGLPPNLALGYVRGDAIDRHLPIEYPGGTARVLDAPLALPPGPFVERT